MSQRYHVDGILMYLLPRFYSLLCERGYPWPRLPWRDVLHSPGPDLPEMDGPLPPQPHPHHGGHKAGRGVQWLRGSQLLPQPERHAQQTLVLHDAHWHQVAVLWLWSVQRGNRKRANKNSYAYQHEQPHRQATGSQDWVGIGTMLSHHGKFKCGVDMQQPH